jgi:hypothetical protein
MLLGLAGLIRWHQVVPRGNVTVLAQLSAAAFGTGWPFYAINLTVTLVLAFAANTSFGGLPVLMQLLAKDHRLPHMFALRAEKPVFRYGVSALAILAAVVLLIVAADTQRLLPVFAIGVFIGSPSAKPVWCCTGVRSGALGGWATPFLTASEQC